MRSFEELVDEAAEASVDGWDFSWLSGRATEERPAWAYARNVADRMTRAKASLDLQTGGGEVLSEAPTFPSVAVATEAWAPNLAMATARLHLLGVAVVHHDDASPLPFANAAFDLVTSRHPVSTDWSEVARVMIPGGTYYSQQVGPASMVELSEAFMGSVAGRSTVAPSGRRSRGSRSRRAGSPRSADRHAASEIQRHWSNRLHLAQMRVVGP